MNIGPIEEEFGGPLMEGTYSVTIKAAEEKLTRAGNGKTLKLTLVVINHKRAGFQMSCYILFEHPSKGAMFYGRRLLKSLLDTVGIDSSKGVNLDPAILVGQIVAVDVIVKDCGPEYGKRNEVVAFKKADINDVPEGTEMIENLDHIPF